MSFLGRTPKPFGFSGGLVDSLSPTQLEANQLTAISNLIPYGKKVITRPAIKVVNPGGLGSLDPADYKLRSILMHVDPESGERTLLGGCYAGFVKLDEVTGFFDYIPVLSGLILGSYSPWSRCQTLGSSYWCRSDSGGILRVTPQFAGRAGIEQPSSAPTLADGGAGGVMSAGDYYVVVRFKNSKTGAISNYSDPSAVQSIAANHKLSVSGIPTSTDFEVDTREVGVTIANRPGTYYLGATISDNLSTTCTIDLTEAQMGDEPWDRRNDPPPGNAKFVAWWDAAQALVTTDGKSLYISETGLPESFSDLIYDFGGDDGFDIVGLLPIGKRVLVGKPNRVDMITGVERADFARDSLTDNYGVAAGLSMKAVGATAFWLAHAKDGLCVVRADGATIKTVNDDKIDALLAQVPPEFVPNAEAWIYPAYNLYCLSLSLGQYTDESRYVPEVIAAYDYKDDRWTTMVFDPRFLGQPDASSFPSQNLAPLSYCDWRGDDGEVVGRFVFDYSRNTSGMDVQPRKPWEYVYTLDPDSDHDPGSKIAWSVTSRLLTPSSAGRQIKPDELMLRAKVVDSNSAPAVATVHLKRNGTAGITATRTFHLTAGENEEEYRLPLAVRSGSQLGTTYAVAISGSGKIELHDDSEITLAESGIRHTIPAQQALRSPEEV